MPGAVIIDASINRIYINGKSKIVGDANEDVNEVASFCTPVPGGIGPMAVITLLGNTIKACKLLSKA